MSAVDCGSMFGSGLADTEQLLFSFFARHWFMFGSGLADTEQLFIYFFATDSFPPTTDFDVHSY